jgi:hypothetical protein
LAETYTPPMNCRQFERILPSRRLSVKKYLPVRSRKAGSFHLDELWSGIADRSGLSQDQTGCGVPGLLWTGVPAPQEPRSGAGLGRLWETRRADGVVGSMAAVPAKDGRILCCWFQVCRTSLRAVEAVIWRHQDLNSLTWVWPRSCSSS